jgi:ubiquitin conjugation factor E4 B
VPFSTHPYCKDYFVESIIQFYVDVEQTGMPSQFYDKISIRHHISKLIVNLIKVAKHHENFVELSKEDVFVKFINLIMNDCTYLVDEGLGKLTEIKVRWLAAFYILDCPRRAIGCTSFRCIDRRRT